MNFRVLIFTSGFFTCANAFAQDSLVTDSVAAATDTGIEYSWYNDSANTTELAHDTGICVSIPCQITKYTVIVSGPNPCVDTTLHVEDPDVYTGPVVTFLPYTTGGWSWGDWSVSFYPITTDYWITVSEPYKNSLQAGFFDTTPLCDSSKFMLYNTEPKQVSSYPPAKTPEPSKPFPLPEQPWYQAVMPNAIRVRKC